ncbi:sugar ABC transporter permease [bacterium]|nr:sugar ABC transporter permease [bacterium]
MTNVQRQSYPYWFLLPAFAIFALMFLVPTGTGIFYSFTDWNINTEKINFVGLQNYRELFTDKKLVAALWHTLVYAFSVTLLRNAIGLGLALLLNTKVKLRGLFRTVFFLPYMISPIIIGYLFTAIYHPANGLLNGALRLVGLKFMAVDWLNDPRYALLSTIFVDVWRTAGFSMVIYLAGLQMIPTELFESASLDGARYPQTFRYVTFPLIAPSLTINLTLSLIGTMKVFVMILVLTNGGPGYATEVINTYVMTSFSLGLYGQGTAANMLLTLLIVLIGFPVLVLLRKREVAL